MTDGPLSTGQLADAYADQGPFLVLRMARRCGSREGVDGVVADTFRSLVESPCPAERLAPELLERACARCAASPVCARSRASGAVPVDAPALLRVG